MQASFQNAPHISLSVEVNVTQMEAARLHMNSLAEKTGGKKVTLTAMLVKLTAWALRRHPYLNSSLVGDTIRLWKDVNLGAEVAASESLIVPVIHSVDRLPLQNIAALLQDQARRAQANQLTLEEVILY